MHKGCIICIAILCFVLLSFMGGCAGKASAYIGKWEKSDGVTIIFERNGDGYIDIYSSKKFNWEVKGSRAVIHIEDQGQQHDVWCDISQDGYLRLYESENSMEPAQVFTRVKK